MSAEGGELTFVRCPSCRSLVPAVSTRCRWCGNSLGGGTSSDAPKDDTPSRRVRQKTRSIQAGEYVPQPTREKGSAEFEESHQEDDYELDDPLKGFIEEVEEEISDEEILSSLAEVEEESQKGAVYKGVNGFGNTEQSPIAMQAPSIDEHGDLSEELEIDFDSDISESLDNLEASPLNEPSAVQDSLTKGLDVAESPIIHQEPVKSTEVAPQRFSTQRVVAPQRQVDRGGDLGGKERANKEPLSVERPALRQPKQGGDMNKTHYEAAEGGRLFGWLVSYATSDGLAFELREGRFFISGTQLKGNDFVIKDSSVSTPHAMVNVSRGGGFAIQDLMSDRGIFIRRKGQDTYQREDGITKCSNGDWIRIGDVEYLLTIVADLGA